MVIVSNVEILINENSIGFTDENGNIEITGLLSGIHTIKAIKECYNDNSATIDIPNETSKSIKLVKMQYKVSIVTEPNATIYSGTSNVGISDNNGNLTFNVNCPGGIIPLKIVKSGYYDLNKEISVTSDTVINNIINENLPMEQTTYDITINITE